MAKAKIVYTCQECGCQAPKWAGQCQDCNAWNTLVEEREQVQKTGRFAGYAATQSKPTLIDQVQITDQVRQSTGSDELDHALGGGMVPGSVVLIGGDPGIGKSTLLLQTLADISCQESALYITGEESLSQVAMRSQRLGLTTDNLTLLAETELEQIIKVAKDIKPYVIVIDSIQTTYTQSLTSTPGSVTQVRESAAALVQFAKQTGVAVFLVGHVTKGGELAGPRVLEHMVDAVLYFEGQSDSRFRVLRAVKNRFGAVNELGVFAMSDKGLKGVNNPSAIFLSNMQSEVSGSSIFVTWEGSRPLLVEVQALLDETHGGNSRRVCVGLDGNRLAMLLAIMNRHGGVMTHNQDVFLNVVGGMRITETASDLPAMLAIYSSLQDQALPADLISFGEVGLGGEIRPVQSGQERLREAAKLGFKRALIPAGNQPKTAIAQLETIPVKTVQDALNAVRDF